MAGKSERSVQLSLEGRHKADRALLSIGSKTDLAAQLEMSRTTITNFFEGKKVDRQKFLKICKILKLDLQEVVELSDTIEAKSVELSKISILNSQNTEQPEATKSKTDSKEFKISPVDRKLAVEIREYLLHLSETEIDRLSQGTIQRDLFIRVRKFLKLEEMNKLDEENKQNRSQNDELVNRLIERIEPTKELIEQVRLPCCQKIEHLYSKIRLLNLQQIDVDRLYVEVHILQRPANRFYATIDGLLEGQNSRDDFDRFGLGRRDEKRLPGLEVANHSQKLMVLGKPGSGKSTFLRFLAISCCKGEFLPNYIPVLIELRSIQDTSQFSLLEMLQQEFRFTNQQQTQDVLSTGKVLLLLDGLDEVADQLRQNIQNQISNLTTDYYYYRTRIILTCRTQTIEHIQQNFEYVEVADFNSEQVALFAQNWFTTLADTPERGIELATRFMQVLRLPEHQRTAELVVTPVLLSLTCWVFQDSGNFPEKRIELYQRGLDLLLEQWDVERGIERTLGGQQYRSLDIEHKQALLSYIAIRKYEKKQSVLFERWEIQRYITEYFQASGQEISDRNSQDVLRAIEAQHGLLVERASKIYSFSHLTFQEFFAAKWLYEPTNRKNLSRYLTETKGKELIRFTLQMPTYANEIAQSLKQSIDFLLAPDEKLQQFLIWVDERARSVNLHFKVAAVRTLYFALACNHIGHTYVAVSHARDLACILDSSLARNLNHTLAHDLAFVRELADDLGFLQDFVLALNRDLDLDIELQYKLQELKNQLPDSHDNRADSQQWWQTKGKSWLSQLRTAVVGHRNLGRNWQIDGVQMQLLQQYYAANKFLTECLNSNCEVSPEVQQEIEETLLLPIAEIEKRKGENKPN